MISYVENHMNASVHMISYSMPYGVRYHFHMISYNVHTHVTIYMILWVRYRDRTMMTCPWVCYHDDVTYPWYHRSGWMISYTYDIIYTEILHVIYYIICHSPDSTSTTRCHHVFRYSMPRPRTCAHAPVYSATSTDGVRSNFVQAAAVSTVWPRVSIALLSTCRPKPGGQIDEG